MIICFNCSLETKKILDHLIESGQYRDYAEAISIAVSNMGVLHRELAQSNAIVIGPKTKLIDKARGSSREILFPYSIPEVFLMKDNLVPPSKFVAPPDDVWVKGQEISLDRWIFGQYNKLLPAKANCRALINLLRPYESGIPIEEATLRISKEAAILGSYLYNHDQKNKIDRDSALSTAFPLSEVKEKSLLRYTSQFLAGMNSQGQLYGLLIDLKLVNYTSGKNPLLFVTEAGWRFGMMPNPILDNLQDNALQKFSDDEIAFFLDHIHSRVPVEDFVFRTILEAILNGADTPGRLDAALERFIPTDRKPELGKAFIATQRSGAISRMSDVGLVKRVREGIKVSYITTDRGMGYLNSHKGGEQ